MTDAQKREKVFQGLECCSQQRGGPELCEQCPYCNEPFPCSNTLLHDALALLREREPRVMTRKEIEGSDGAEFYSEHKGEEYLYMDHTEGPAYIMGNMGRFSLKHLRWEDYGKTWRCWTSRPSDEQRKAVKWE